MKKLYFIFIVCLFSSCEDSDKETNRLQVELKEAKQENIRLQNKLKQINEQLNSYAEVDEIKVDSTSTTSL